MKRITTQQKKPRSIIQFSGSNVNYNLSQEKYSANIEIASTGGISSNQVRSRFSKGSNHYEYLRNEHKNYKEIFITEVFNQIIQRRKRYSFQMIKLLYMFPDDSFSENFSVNSYDRLIYQDEHLHTIVKIYETNQLQAKIWAFLNLKLLHKRKKLQKFTAKIETVQEKMKIKIKKDSFFTIHQYSIRIKPEKKITVQRMQPIQTKFFHNIVNSQPKQSQKTQRIQRTSITKIIQNNNTQIIRLPQQDTTPKRIVLEPENPVINKIYPISTVQNIVQNSKTQIRSEKNTQHKIYIPLKTQDYSRKIEDSSRHTTEIYKTQPRVSYPTRRVQQSRYIEYSKPLTTINDTVKRIEPIPIQIHSPSTYYSRPTILDSYQVRERRHVASQQPLVHTVNGDCTINIHNGCNNCSNCDSKNSSTRCKSLSKQQFHHSISASSSCHCNHSMTNHHACLSHHSHNYNCTSCCACTKPCCCQFVQHNHHHHCNNDRINYLRYLQQMSKRNQYPTKSQIN